MSQQSSSDFYIWLPDPPGAAAESGPMPGPVSPSPSGPSVRVTVGSETVDVPVASAGDDDDEDGSGYMPPAFYRRSRGAGYDTGKMWGLMASTAVLAVVFLATLWSGRSKGALMPLLCLVLSGGCTVLFMTGGLETLTEGTAALLSRSATTALCKRGDDKCGTNADALAGLCCSAGCVSALVVLLRWYLAGGFK